MWDLRRLNRNRETKNAELEQTKLKNKQLNTQIKQLKSELRSANVNLNRKCVRAAMKFADVLTKKR